MPLRNLLKTVVPSLLLAGFGGIALAADPAPAKPPTTKPAYPLTTCVVSGEKLGEMGKPFVIRHDGREVRLCCEGCQDDFKKDPAKYLKKIDEAAKRPATQPSKKAEPADPHPSDEDRENVYNPSPGGDRAVEGRMGDLEANPRNRASPA